MGCEIWGDCYKLHVRMKMFLAAFNTHVNRSSPLWFMVEM